MDIDQATLNDQTAAPQETAAPSMAESMAATLAGIRERETASVDSGEAATKAERARAPDGKFAKVEDGQPASTTESNQPTAAQPSQVGQDAGQDGQTNLGAPAATIQPPSSWTAAAKAEFAKASPVVQQEVLRREQQMHDGIAQYKEKATFAESMQKAIAPFEHTIRGMGVTPEVAISALLNADHQLRYGSPSDKMQSLLQIAKSYGVDISQGIPEQQQVDPNFQYLQNELQTTKQQLNQFLTAQQQREQMELNSQIERAKQGKEHFDAVRNEMAALLQAGSAKDIDEAYDMAVYARPDLRQALLAKQLEEKLAAENQRRAEEAKKADEAAKAAKAAAAPNVARRGTLPAQKSPGSMRDTMLETLEQIRSR
jgi:hypothetical protein